MTIFCTNIYFIPNIFINIANANFCYSIFKCCRNVEGNKRINSLPGKLKELRNYSFFMIFMIKMGLITAHAIIYVLLNVIFVINKKWDRSQTVHAFSCGSGARRSQWWQLQACRTAFYTGGLVIGIRIEIKSKIKIWFG